MGEPGQEPSEQATGGNQAVFQKQNVNPAELLQVIEWMVAGHSGETIGEAIGEKFPKSNPKDLMIAAGDHFRDICKADSSVLLGWCLDSTRDIYQKMVAFGDFSGALKAIKQIRDFTK